MNELDAVECCLRDAARARSATLFSELETLVAIPTGRFHHDGLDAIRALLVERLQAIGATTTLHAGEPRPNWLAGGVASSPPPTVVCAHAGNGSGPRILLAGHLDTVHDPEGDFDRLTLEENGIARGPGAADMKGGVLIAVTALELLAEQGVDCNWSFLLNSDEETGTFCSAEHLRAAAHEHDVGLVMEPALPDGSLVVERMGSGQFRIAVDGRGAHVGREFERGISAVKTLAEVMLEVLALADAPNGRIVNIGPLEGGEVTNAVPHFAACWGNVRFADPAAQAQLAASFDAIAHRWSCDENGAPLAEDHRPRVQIDRTFNRPAKPMTAGVEQLANQARAVAEALGQKLPFAKTGGVCDANVLQAEGLPVIDTLGVRGGNLHRTDEFIEVDSLWERTALMAILIKRIAVSTR